MTLRQLHNAICAIPRELWDATVYQDVRDGIIVTTEVRVWLAGHYPDSAEAVVLMVTHLAGEVFPPADLAIVPGDVV